MPPLVTVGRGESELVAPNTRPGGRDHPVGREHNRRVEILLERRWRDPPRETSVAQGGPRARGELMRRREAAGRSPASRRAPDDGAFAN